MLNDLKNLEKVLKDIDRLKKRSYLLEIILHYYDSDSMDFVIPEKWAGKVDKEKMPALTPKEMLYKNIVKSLGSEELNYIGIFDNHWKSL